MTTDAVAASADTFSYSRRGRWLDRWEPDNETFWENGGRQTARKNLGLSVFAENLGFSIWVLWASVVTAMGSAGFDFLDGLGKGNPVAVGNSLLLTSTPTLVGAALRIPYTFAIPKFGGRAFTVFSAGMLLVPTVGLAYFVNQPGTPFWVFLVLAALAGVGGGNFSSSMANINFFFPRGKRVRPWASTPPAVTSASLRPSCSCH
ncbi:hypothetical protein [Nocardia terpenica]|uniref:hypothetical protein n=1 Tax=Nocardia terpenica TaxID=455432 RepID=UPI001EEC5E22|nr:hypothetical protein [Nocardia terpenica]